MREALRKLTSESAVYGLGAAGGRAVQLLLVPVLTRALDPGAYGVSELVVGYSQTAVLILVMGMDGALARFFYQEPDREAKLRIVSTSLVFRSCLGLGLALALAALAAPLADRLVGGEIYGKYLRIGAFTLPFTLLAMFSNDVLRVTFQPWKFILLNLTQTVLTTSLALNFVIREHMGVAGILYGRLAGDAVAALLGLVLIRHTLAPRFDRAVLARMLSYGAPMVPALIAFGVMASADRFVLQEARTLDELAIYAVAMKFFTVITFAASAFQLAYGPFVFARAASPDAPRIYARALAAYVVIGSLGAFLFGVFAPEVLAVLVPSHYHAAGGPALLLAFAAVALGAYSVGGIGIGLALRTSLVGFCVGGPAVLAVALQFALVPRFGITGAAVATGIGYLAATVSTYVVAQRVHPLPFRGARLLGLFVVALGLALATQRWSPGGAFGVAVKLAVAAAFAGIAWRSGVWEVEPRSAGPAPA